MATQSRIAALTASLSVRAPASTGITSAPEQPHPLDVRAPGGGCPRCPCRRRTRGRSSAHAVAVATPCWPAPVSAITRRLAHPPGEQRLADRVVDLVGAGVGEVLALQVDAARRPAPRAARRGRAASAGRRSRAAARRARAWKPVVLARLSPGGAELVERRDQRLGDEAAAVGAEALLDCGAHRDAALEGSSTPAASRKRLDLGVVLAPGLGLDAADHVDGERADQLDRLGDVLGASGRPPGSSAPSSGACATRSQSKLWPVPPWIPCQ